MQIEDEVHWVCRQNLKGTTVPSTRKQTGMHCLGICCRYTLNEHDIRTWPEKDRLVLLKIERRPSTLIARKRSYENPPQCLFVMGQMTDAWDSAEQASVSAVLRNKSSDSLDCDQKSGRLRVLKLPLIEVQGHPQLPTALLHGPLTWREGYRTSRPLSADSR
jgi:hypothetical protein